MPEDRERGEIRNDVYLFVIPNEYEDRPQISALIKRDYSSVSSLDKGA
jgi:hypothetical protein